MQLANIHLTKYLFRPLSLFLTLRGSDKILNKIKLIHLILQFNELIKIQKLPQHSRPVAKLQTKTVCTLTL